MASPNTIYRSRLKDHHLSDTKTRYIVFRALLSSVHLPLSMNELIKVIGNKMDRATIYRTIELFESINITNKTYVGWKYRIELSDEFNDHHHHMTCTDCGRVISLKDISLEQKIARIGDKYGFRIDEHQVELRGVCKDCCN